MYENFVESFIKQVLCDNERTERKYYWTETNHKNDKFTSYFKTICIKSETKELNLRLFQVSLRAKKTKQNKKENLKQVTSPTKWKWNQRSKKGSLKFQSFEKPEVANQFK